MKEGQSAATAGPATLSGGLQPATSKFFISSSKLAGRCSRESRADRPWRREREVRPGHLEGRGGCYDRPGGSFAIDADVARSVDQTAEKPVRSLTLVATSGQPGRSRDSRFEKPGAVDGASVAAQRRAAAVALAFASGLSSGNPLADSLLSGQNSLPPFPSKLGAWPALPPPHRQGRRTDRRASRSSRGVLTLTHLPERILPAGAGSYVTAATLPICGHASASFREFRARVSRGEHVEIGPVKSCDRRSGAGG